jgi:hypothetical protein
MLNVCIRPQPAVAGCLRLQPRQGKLHQTRPSSSGLPMATKLVCSAFEKPDELPHVVR